jgi:hypothetical protein
MHGHVVKQLKEKDEFTYNFMEPNTFIVACKISWTS